MRVARDERASFNPRRTLMPLAPGPLAGTRNIMTIKNSKTQFEVLWPLGRKAVRVRSAAARLPDLAGKTVGELWEYIFRGEVVYPIIREHLRARFTGIKFVEYSVFGNFHGANSKEIVVGLAPQSIRQDPAGRAAALCRIRCSRQEPAFALA